MSTLHEIATDRAASRAFHREKARFFIALARTYQRDGLTKLYASYVAGAKRERMRAITCPFFVGQKADPVELFA